MDPPCTKRDCHLTAPELQSSQTISSRSCCNLAHTPPDLVLAGSWLLGFCHDKFNTSLAVEPESKVLLQHMRRSCTGGCGLRARVTKLQDSEHFEQFWECQVVYMFMSQDSSFRTRQRWTTVMWQISRNPATPGNPQEQVRVLLV